MNAHKPWQPRVRGEPIFNPFEPSTDWTRDLGANERVEVPEEDEATAEDQPKPKDEQSPPK
jgi:hypothetical protein